MADKEPIWHWFLRVFPKAFFIVLIPFYGGYQRAPLASLAVYILVAGAFSFYYFGEPGPRQLWQQSRLRGLALGWLLMSLVIAIGAVPTFGLGYLISN